MAGMTATTWGWFHDPYHEHEHRYFSGGLPTKLVRDSGLESFDPPPDLPMRGTPVPATSFTGRHAGETDMRRADDVDKGAPYVKRDACERAMSAIIRFGSSD